MAMPAVGRQASADEMGDSGVQATRPRPAPLGRGSDISAGLGAGRFVYTGGLFITLPDPPPHPQDMGISSAKRQRPSSRVAC